MIYECTLHKKQRFSQTQRQRQRQRQFYSDESQSTNNLSVKYYLMLDWHRLRPPMNIRYVKHFHRMKTKILELKRNACEIRIAKLTKPKTMCGGVNIMATRPKWKTSLDVVLIDRNGRKRSHMHPYIWLHCMCMRMCVCVCLCEHAPGGSSDN